MNRSIPIIFVLILAIAGVSCNSTRTEISGQIRGGEDISLTLERLDVNRTSVVDSLKTGKDGSFSIRLRLEEPELFILKNNKGALINLLVNPGDRILVQSSLASFGSNYEVRGSEESERIRLLVEHLNQTRKNLDSLQLVAGSIGDPDDPQFDLVKNSYAQAIIKQKRFTIKYLVEHMGSLSSVYALYQKYDEESLILNLENDIQYFKAVADSLEVTYPNSSKVNALLGMAEEASGILEISIPDREGTEIALSSLQGKVCLVTFWASGNRASIDALIRLQSTYNKYRDKGFEIYAISLDNNKINWMNAIDFNEFRWINVSELSFPASDAARLYNITELPTTFLINREGDIVAKNLYGRTLETWLDNLI